MGKEIPLEIRFRAEELYVVDGLTYEQVAEATGVSDSQLKRWGAESGWGERKREYRESLSSIRRDTVILRQRLIEKALNSLDPQSVYAVARLEAVANKAVSGVEPVQTLPADNRVIKTPEDAVMALGDVIEKKLNTMLTQPGGISLSAVKEIKQAVELVEKMREKYADAEGKALKKGGLSDEVANDIRAKILGL
ncbi:MAG: hypothetical protein FP814_09745 [Desulfobacterium sp.]|nr:hypothetical protein [Desulfobacteraceae bacterium]MBA3036763.1 hypothetical protein [Desulfobacterium sp.]